ncbi:MAG: ADP-glyceromanno-heptose 6-epimerase [Bacteroidetes bacterium HGW-Bacteroidetes-1]|jgi:ADP-L-glycero-D-manno-heptose 6-epimerase|nr:MAG: ADP-glyceromanno-heptose 6-epimerase [Bacteroidetes bacterium HGW-Bacteroidetes-1]
MIVITGAAGFIGSVTARFLNKAGYSNLVLVDAFNISEKKPNYEKLNYDLLIERDNFITWLNFNHKKVDWIIHLGARTDTTEFDTSVFDKLNLNYSKQIWDSCSKNEIPLIYASSAATYGMGEFGYEDNHDLVAKLKPLNPYGESKNNFDKWVLEQKTTPPFWAGLKFFNVYGPNEYHKSRMASVVFHAFNQIREKGYVSLFKSHNPDYEDGKQLRDFVYVKDVAEVISFLMQHKPANGLYNLGTGHARSFLDLASSTFDAMNLDAEIHFIDTPEDIRDKYQYFTEAKMDKLINVGYNQLFSPLEKGVEDYVRNYLSSKNYF